MLYFLRLYNQHFNKGLAPSNGVATIPVGDCIYH